VRVAVIAVLALGACGDNLPARFHDAAIDGPGCAACADIVTGGAAISCMGSSDCAAADSDNDGVSDVAETIGYLDFDCDGALTIADLPLPGADPDIPNIWVELDYFERDLPATPRACVTDADCATSAIATGERNDQCFCQLSPDSCPSGQTCDPRTRRCTGDATTGHFCTHSHKPPQAALEMIMASFQAPGLVGPWGSFAHAPIILTFDPDSDRIAERAVISFGTDATVACPASGECPSGIRCAPNTTCEPVCPAGSACRTLDPACAGNDAVHFDDVKDAHFDPKKRWVFRYGVLAHWNSCASSGTCATCPIDPATGLRPATTSTGIAEMPGNDLIVSMGRQYFDSAPTPTLFPEAIAGELMHSLGHTLGLHHGGHTDIQRSPNYVSVMNPSFQPVIFRAQTLEQNVCQCSFGPSHTCCPRRVDFSHQVLPTLDETALDENRPIGEGRDISNYFCTPPNMGLRRPTTSVAVPVDWNCNGTIESSVSEDINSDVVPIGSPGDDVHVGQRDWPYACPASGTCDACGIPAPIRAGIPSTDSTCPVDQNGVIAESGTLPCVLGQCQRFEYRFQCRDGGRAD